FTATGRSSTTSIARQTSPMPPPDIRPSSRYRDASKSALVGRGTAPHYPRSRGACRLRLRAAGVTHCGKLAINVGPGQRRGQRNMAEPGEPQPVLSPLTAAAIFLVLAINSGGESAVRDLLGDLAALQRSVGFRIPEGELACVAAIGSAAWDRLFTGPRPAELH